MLPRKFFDKNGVIWCILSVTKLVIINLKINFFLYQQPKFCAKYFSKINPDAHFDTQKNTFTLKEGRGGGGGNSPQKLKKCKKKWRLYVFHTRREDISCNDVDLDSC